MQLFKSFICLQGREHGGRFLISLFSFSVAFLFLGSTIISGFAAQCIFAFAFTFVAYASSLRRCHDGKLKRLFAGLNALLFLAAAILSVLLESGLAFLAFSFCYCLTFWLSVQKSAEEVNYQLGYAGPVDLSSFLQPLVESNHRRTERIEPSLFGQQPPQDNDEFAGITTQQFATDPAVSINAPSTSSHIWIEQLQTYYKQYKLATHLIMATLMLISLVSLTWPMLTVPAQQELNSSREAENPVIIDKAKIRQHLLAMPDDFYLLLSEHQGLIIHWKADLLDDGVIWSQTTAKGDDTCAAIEFNRGDSVRTLSVEIEDAGNYYANFSPLDTETVIRLLAIRGQFSLCGYNFSLKGSQKALNSSPHYIDMAN
ncbi:hypothetical protein [Thalassotalea aquiviva]|uniref:hypothetical protein n=1 Tax=Thalassotalea aquiviva TaxID=3242415 RepID=UPI00352ADC0B